MSATALRHESPVPTIEIDLLCAHLCAYCRLTECLLEFSVSLERMAVYATRIKGVPGQEGEMSARCKVAEIASKKIHSIQTADSASIGPELETANADHSLPSRM